MGIRVGPSTAQDWLHFTRRGNAWILGRDRQRTSVPRHGDVASRTGNERGTDWRGDRFGSTRVFVSQDGMLRDNDRRGVVPNLCLPERGPKTGRHKYSAMKVAIRGSRDLTFVELRRFAKLCDPPASSEIGDPRASRISDHENAPSGRTLR